MDVPEIEVADLAPRLSDGASVLDVREVDEVAEARIPGVLHVPLMEVPARLDEIPDSVFVVCAVGARSHKAAEFLIGQGRDATNVVGGVKAWLAAGLPYDSGPIAS